MALNVWQRTITLELPDPTNGNDRVVTVPNAEVEVLVAGTTTAADLFSDAAGNTAITNPFDADANGFAQFYVLTGKYDITVTGGGGSQTWANVQMGDFRDGVNLKDDYGAVGDGVTDDTAAIQAFRDYYNANGGDVYIPPGDYVNTANIVFARTGGRIIGAGSTSTIFRGGGTIAYATEHDFEISGFTVISATGDGIVIGETAGSKTNAAWFKAFDLKTNFSGGRGIAIGKAIMGDIYGLRAQNSTGIGIDMSTGLKTSLSVRDCHALDGDTDGWKIKNIAYSSIVAAGADRNAGYAYNCENMFNVDFNGGAEDHSKSMFLFHFDNATTDTIKGFAGVRVNGFEKDNDTGGTTAAFGHFTSTVAAAYAGDITFDGCAHYTTPTGDALKIDSGNYRLIMPPSRNRIKPALSGGSFSVISDGAGDIPYGLTVNVTGANTPIATLRPKLRNGVSTYGGRLTVYVTNNPLGSAARSATYELLLTRAVGTSGITTIASTGNTAGSTTDSASFTFALDAANNHLEVTPVGSTATGNWYFHISAVGNIDVEML